jgi:hypothetical protein
VAPTFETALEWRIARELALRPSSQQELFSALGVDRKRLRRVLTDLQGRDLVDFHETASGHVGRGHARGLWSLRGHPPERAPVDDEFADAATWRSGQTWVAARADPPTPERLREIMTVLADGSLTVAASWITQLDGNGRQVVVAFERALGSQPADRLLDALDAAGIACETGTVRAVADPVAIAAHAQSIVAQREAASRSSVPTS